MDPERRAVFWQWVIGTIVVVLAAWAALYTPSMPEPPAAPESVNGTIPQASDLPSAESPIEGEGPR
jgi:hypothetical protein